MTPTSTTSPRPALAVVVLLVGLLAGLLAPTGTAHAAIDGGAESQFVAALNQARAAQGLPALSVAGDLTSVARSHSSRMADGNNLHHNPNLGSHVSGWQKVGENVGKGPSVNSIHSAFMNSPSHRANILGADWTQVGVGVDVRGGTVWVTQVFRQPAGAPAPAPEPEREPKSAPATSEPKPEAAPAASSPAAPASSDATSSKADDRAAAQPEREPDLAEALPPVAPEADRALVMMTRVAGVDADLDAMTS